jgi:hypothetical protein
MADGNDIVKLPLKGHRDCTATRRRRPSGADGKMYVAHILADEPSLSENKPHFIEEEEVAS